MYSLITGDTKTVQDRPNWAIAQQGIDGLLTEYREEIQKFYANTASPSPSALEDLQKEALDISLSSLSNITIIGEGKLAYIYHCVKFSSICLSTMLMQCHCYCRHVWRSVQSSNGGHHCCH